MPMYEYRCSACGVEFEELVFKDDEQVPCPGCGSLHTEKLLSCCRFKSAGGNTPHRMAAPASGGSKCSGCSGGNCSTC